MLVSELMEYPKIRALMEKYWANDECSGVWGSENIANRLGSAFILSTTEEGYKFWDDLDMYDLQRCKDKYPEYFTKEEEETTVNHSVDIEYLHKWPKLWNRAFHIVSHVGSCHSFEGAASLYYDKCLHIARPEWVWEGTSFWRLIDLGGFTLAQKKIPELFEKGDVPKLSPNEPTIGAKPLDVLGLKPQGSGDLKAACDTVLEVFRAPEPQYNPDDVSFKAKEPVKKVPKARDLIYYILSTPDSDPPIVWEYTLTSCDLLPVMQELDDFIEEYELNWSVEANFWYDGAGYLEITGYYKDVVGKTSKVILVWES